MSVLRGDFIGFTFDGIHSSNLGIIRTSSGDRYELNLSPAFTDRTAYVPGSDETYYFGTNFTSKTHRIDIAFDSMTEKQLRQLKQLFCSKKVSKLIYDETPYKYYLVKSASVPSLKFLCFDNEVGQRVYKGEGTIELVSYCPYAFSRYKYLEDYQALENDITNSYKQIPEWQKNESNIDEWIESSGIISKNYTYRGSTYVLDTPFLSNGLAAIFLYNPGDKETPVDIITSGDDDTGKIKVSITSNKSRYLVLNKGNPFELKDGDTYIKIKSKEGVIVGLNNNLKETGNLYNEYMPTSTGFYLPVLNEPQWFFLCGGTNNINRQFILDYKYIYY